MESGASWLHPFTDAAWNETVKPDSGALLDERIWSMNRARNFTLAVAALLCAAFTLSACEEDEQDRILRYEKGTYLGQDDKPLDQETLDELRSRVRNQKGA